MLRSHPVLCPVAAAYAAVVCMVSFGPGHSLADGAVVAILVFVPLGILLVLLLGSARWRLAVFFGVLVCVWVEIGRSVWNMDRGVDALVLLANAAGMLAGVVLGVLLARSAVRALPPVSQPRLQGLTHDSPSD